MSKHYLKHRNRRERLIKNVLHGDGTIIDGFVIDKGHKNGAEVHSVTENGVILIHNYDSGVLCTKIVAREGQIKRLYKNSGRQAPKWLLDLCRWHQSLNYNK